MPVVITDRRAILNEADTLTDWTGADTVVTDSFAEGPASLAEAYNEGEGPIYYTTGTPIDMSNTLMYVWSSVVATQDSWQLGYHGLLVGDGTNRINFHQQGNDRRVFAHSDGPVGWSCFVLDGAAYGTLTGDTNLYTTIDGAVANLNMAAITDLGSYYITLSKALGGGVNCYNDIIRYGNDGIRVTSGTTSSAGTFLQIAIADRSTADGAGHGIFRELGQNVYSCIGPITIGNSGTPQETIFTGSGAIVAWENRDIADGKYYFNVEGAAGALTEFGLTGCALSTSGPSLRMNFASGNIDTFALANTSFAQLRGQVLFSDQDDSSGHTIDTCTFINCDQVSLGAAGFTALTVNETAAVTGGTDIFGAVYIATGNTFDKVDGVRINSYADGVGLLLEDTVTGTVSMTDWIFDGSGYVDIYWKGTAGTLTINLDATSNPGSWDSSGGTVNLVSTTNYTLTNLQPDTEVRIYTSGTTDDLTTAGDELYGVESVTGSTTFQYGNDVITSGQNVVVMIHNVQYETIRFITDLDGTDTTQQIQQQFDRNYENP